MHRRTKYERINAIATYYDLASLKNYDLDLTRDYISVGFHAELSRLGA